MYETRLYFEAHVTIAPVFDERREEAAQLAKKHGFRLAKLIMRKSVKETEQESRDDTFMTSTGIEYEMIRTNLVHLITELNLNEFEVFRYKIENTLMDSQFEDKLKLLTSRTTKRYTGTLPEESEGIKSV